MKHARAAGPGGRRRRAVLIGGFAAVLAAAVGITATAFAAGASFSDNFEDGDTAGWSKSGGSWSVVTDGTKVLRQADAGSSLARMFAGDSGWTDYTVQARVRAVSLAGSAAVVGRATGAHQFVRLALVPGATRLEEVRGSTVTALGSAPLASAASGWHTLRLDVVGKNITGYVDGALVGKGTTAKLGKGRVGLVTESASASFDDVRVSAPAGAPAPAPTAPTTAPTKAPTSAPTKAPTSAPTKSPTTAPTASPSTKPSAPAPTSTTVVTTWPKATSTTTLTATKPITGTFDGGNVRFVGGGALGGSGQEEGQDPLFKLADGATLANVIIGTPGADGVHCSGTCTLRNVWWEDVGEDAATFKGTSASQTMTVIGGGARKAADKTFQHNGPGTFIIRDFQASDIGKLYRSCGNCSKQTARHVQVSNVTVTVPLKSLVGVNSNFGDTAKISNVTIIGGTGKTVICSIFKGVTSGEPTEISKVPDGKSCTATGIILK